MPRKKAWKKAWKKAGLKARAEGKQAVALNMLKKQADMAFIAEVTGLSEKEN